MPNFDKPPWSTILAVLEERALPIILVVVVAWVLLRASRLFVHGIVKTLMDREATEGTAQELSAVELKKRMDTLDGLGGNVIRFFIVIIAGLMVLRTFDLDIGPAVAGLGVVGVAVGFGAQHLVRDYLTGALILIENQYSKGDVIRVAGVSGTVEDFSLRRTTLRLRIERFGLDRRLGGGRLQHQKGLVVLKRPLRAEKLIFMHEESLIANQDFLNAARGRITVRICDHSQKL